MHLVSSCRSAIVFVSPFFRAVGPQHEGLSLIENIDTSLKGQNSSTDILMIIIMVIHIYIYDNNVIDQSERRMKFKCHPGSISISPLKVACLVRNMSPNKQKKHPRSIIPVAQLLLHCIVDNALVLFQVLHKK